MALTPLLDFDQHPFLVYDTARVSSAKSKQQTAVNDQRSANSTAFSFGS